LQPTDEAGGTPAPSKTTTVRHHIVHVAGHRGCSMHNPARLPFVIDTSLSRP
jgi:hypothetical protein